MSHLPLDMLPHFDSTREVELSTTALGLLAVGAICKPRSPEFWGAVGGVLPDLEVALQRFGVLDEEHLIFPTHRYPFLHGENFPKPVIQPIFWVLALGALLLRPGRRKGRGEP